MLKIFQEFLKRIDVPLFTFTVLIIMLGFVTLSGSNFDTSQIILSQILNIFVGLLIFTILIFTNPKILFGYTPLLFLDRKSVV